MYTTLLTNIKNAQSVGKDKIKHPYSKMDEAVLTVLREQGFIQNAEKKGKAPKRYLEVTLAYKNGRPAIDGFRFISTPSSRVYRPADEIPRVRQGFGITVLSTSKGIFTDKEARKSKIGGQMLFSVW